MDFNFAIDKPLGDLMRRRVGVAWSKVLEMADDEAKAKISDALS